MFPGTFERLYCAMVAAGETSGRLDVVLSRLADYTEQRQIMRNRLLQALLYPCVLTLKKKTLLCDGGGGGNIRSFGRGAQSSG
ncbi:type II secretion system F family protein [Escherichia coli]|uniref:type II secretion system F family protein n=1 Tax=Escherichia coli TaxID=562 RepID=UPI003D9A76C9